MKIKKLVVTIQPSLVFDDYATVDIIVECDTSPPKEAHELLPVNDFSSKFSDLLEILKSEVMDNLEYGDG